MSKQVYFIGNSGMVADSFENQSFKVFYSFYIEMSPDKKYYLFKVNGGDILHRLPVDDYCTKVPIDEFADKIWKEVIETIRKHEEISVINFNSIMRKLTVSRSLVRSRLPKKTLNTNTPLKEPADASSDKTVHYTGGGASIDFEDETLFRQWVEGKLVGDLEIRRRR